MSEVDVVVDWEQIEMISDGFSPEFLEIFHEFAFEMPGLLEALGGAFAACDFDAARRVAHQIKGSAANFGFVGLSRTAASLETLAKASSWDGFESGLGVAHGQFAAAMDLLREQRGVVLPER